MTFAIPKRPAPNNLRINQGSLTVGGPVWLPKIYNGRDRTFFFFAYEPRWRRDFVVMDALMPIDAMRAGDFNGLAKIANGWAPADMAAKFGIPVTSTNTTIYQQFDLVGNKLTPITLRPLSPIPNPQSPIPNFPLPLLLPI